MEQRAEKEAEAHAQEMAELRTKHGRQLLAMAQAYQAEQAELARMSKAQLSQLEAENAELAKRTAARLSHMQKQAASACNWLLSVLYLDPQFVGCFL